MSGSRSWIRIVVDRGSDSVVLLADGTPLRLSRRRKSRLARLLR